MFSACGESHGLCVDIAIDNLAQCSEIVTILYFGPKTCKISVDFIPLQTLIMNISRMSQDIQNQKAK